MDLLWKRPPLRQQDSAVPALHPATDDHLRGRGRQHLLQDRRSHRIRRHGVPRLIGRVLFFPHLPQDHPHHGHRRSRFHLAGNREIADGDREDQHHDPLHHRRFAGVQPGAVQFRGDRRLIALCHVHGPDPAHRRDHNDARAALSGGVHGSSQYAAADPAVLSAEWGVVAGGLQH